MPTVEQILAGVTRRPRVVPQTRPPRTVLCHGVFDLLHVAHVWTLRWAKAQGDRLVVTVTPDSEIRARKGHLPVYPLAHRMELLDALGFVDLVVPGRGSTALWSLRTFAPQVWVRGFDWLWKWTPASRLEEAQAKRTQTRVEWAPAWVPDYRSSAAMEQVKRWNSSLEAW